jgi:hypothetical protein
MKTPTQFDGSYNPLEILVIAMVVALPDTPEAIPSIDPLWVERRALLLTFPDKPVTSRKFILRGDADGHCYKGTQLGSGVPKPAQNAALQEGTSLRT